MRNNRDIVICCHLSEALHDHSSRYNELYKDTEAGKTFLLVLHMNIFLKIFKESDVTYFWFKEKYHHGANLKSVC